MERWNGRACARNVLVAAATLVSGGCGWAGLAADALATPTSREDASTNVAIADGVAWVAQSARGIERIALATGQRRRIPLPPLADRIDDLAVADGLLFALDATPPGHLVVYRIGPETLQPVVVREVAVGPFSGVAAAGGQVIVSGGTSTLELLHYAPDGHLQAVSVGADFGRGQPDVALSPSGRVALVSTHVRGPRFGLTVADVGATPLALHARGYVELVGAGFSQGGFRPANFPLQAAAFGDIALVAHGGGLSVVDAAPGRAPGLIGTMPLGLHATAIAVDRARRQAFVTGVGTHPQLLTFDLSEPRRPRLLSRASLMAYGSPSAIALDATHVVVAMQGGGVHLMARTAPPPAAPIPEIPR